MSDIPRGLCQCGCGAPVGLAKCNNPSRGWVKGEPLRYLQGHACRKPAKTLGDLMGNTDGSITGCSEWRGPYNEHGYGYIVKNRRVVRVHREVWELTNGRIPEGLIIRHKCDNPKCCKVEHLELGTKRDNTQDMLARGRVSSGGMHATAKLTDAQALDIRQSRGATKDLADYYKVSTTTIRNIRSRISWKYLE